jgi:membrane protein implicated in regulation of membrane protease activity
MHPLIILLPLLGLIVFLILPISLALPVYLVILLLSGLMYWAIISAMKRRPNSGSESMIGAKARVVSKLRYQDEAQYAVKVRGELWNANSPDDLKPGETAKILSIDGLTLIIKKDTKGQISQIQANS